MHKSASNMQKIKLQKSEMPFAKQIKEMLVHDLVVVVGELWVESSVKNKGVPV